MKINQAFSLLLNEMCIKVVLLKLTLYRLSYKPVRMPRARGDTTTLSIIYTAKILEDVNEKYSLFFCSINELK